MKSEKMLDAIGKIDDQLVRDAILDTKRTGKTGWVRLGAMAACFCLLLGSLVLLGKNGSVPPVTDSNSLPPSIGGSDDPTAYRGGDAQSTDAPEPSLPVEVGEQIHVYETESLGFDLAAVNKLQSALEAAGWAGTECTLVEDDFFVLKGAGLTTARDLGTEASLDLAKAFLADSGLSMIFQQRGMAYEFEAESADTLTVTCCYFLCEGARTGAYIRFIFEDWKRIGEVQAYLYDSRWMESLPLLKLEEALKHAQKVDTDGKLVPVDAADYDIRNVKLIYRNGLPYYEFMGYGIEIRLFIEGYALAVDISTSENEEVLAQRHGAFRAA